MADALIQGPRVRGGDYTAEEMDVARAVGKCILDVVAGAKAKVLSARSKHVFHDETLPQLQRFRQSIDGLRAMWYDKT